MPTSSRPTAALYVVAQPALNNHRTEVAFVLDNVADWQTLAAAVPAGVAVVVLDGHGDGLAQMADWLAQYAPGSVDAIHLLGHGSSGAIDLGALTLTGDNLNDHTDTLARIGAALTAEGDWLIYGCNVAAGAAGLELVGRLAQASGADVAASVDATGAVALGGNWVLEQQIGLTEASLPFDTSASIAYSHVLADVNFDFDGDVTNGDLSATQLSITVAVGSDTLKINSTGEGFYVGHVGPTIYDDLLFGSPFDNSLAAYSFGGSNYQTSVTLSVQGGKLFNLNAFAIAISSGENEAITLTTNTNKTYSFTVNGAQNGGDGDPQTIDVATNTLTDFQDITSVTITSSDGQFLLTLDNIVLFNIHSNTAPTLGGTFTTAGTVNDNDITTPFYQVTYSDTDNTSGTVAITYTGANGTLAGTGLTGSAGNYTLSGANPTEITTRLQALVFTPTANQVAPASTMSTTFTLMPNDGTVNGTANATTVVTSTSINNAPTFVGATTLTVNENASATDIAALLHIHDTDASQTITWTQSVAPSQGGALTISSATKASGTADITPGGTLTYAPAANFVGTETFTIQASDGTASTTRQITVTVNDVDPVLTASLAFDLEENSAANTVVGTVTSTGDTNGLSWSVTGGTGQSLFNINSATGAITVATGAVLNFEGTNNYTLNVAVDDEDIDTTADATTIVTVNLTNVNEKPALTAPASQNVTQNSATALTGISVADPDAGSNAIEVSFFAPTGTFNATSGSGVTALGSGSNSITLDGQQSNINAFIAASKVTYTTAAGATGSVTLAINSIDNQIPTLTDSKTETLNITTSNATPTLTNLNTDSVPWAGVGSSVRIDSGADAVVADADFGALNGGNGNWSGGSLTFQRTGTAVTTDLFGFDLAGALFTVSGGNLQVGVDTFASFTRTGGVLTVAFAGGVAAGTIIPTTDLVKDVLRRVTFGTNSPTGNMGLTYSLSDGSTAASGTVTVTSNLITVNATADTSDTDRNSVTLREAVAIAAAQSAGPETLVLASTLAITLELPLTLTESLTLDADAVSGFILNN